MYLKNICKNSYQYWFYFFSNLIHLYFPILHLQFSLHVSDRLVHHQENQLFNYTGSLWHRSLGR